MAKKKKELTITELARRGGKARAKKLTPKQLSEQAQNAAQARWKKNDAGKNK
jgi:hypothetical protein